MRKNSLKFLYLFSLVALGFGLPALAAPPQPPPADLQRFRGNLPNTPNIPNTIGPKRFTPEQAGQIQEVLDQTNERSVRDVLGNRVDTLDPCLRIYEHLKTMNRCPEQTGETCTHLLIKLETTENHQCRLCALKPDESGCQDSSSGHIIGLFQGVAETESHPFGNFYWTPDNLYYLRVLFGNVDMNAVFLESTYYTLHDNQRNVDVGIAFDKIQYEPAFQIADDNPTGFPGLPEGIAEGVRDAAKKFYEECQKTFVCRVSGGRILNPKDLWKKVIASADPIPTPAIDPVFSPPKDTKVTGLATEEVTGGGGSCQLNTNYHLLQGWVGFVLLAIALVVSLFGRVFVKFKTKPLPKKY